MVVNELAPHEIDRIFHALADATRRDILRRVSEEDLSITALAGCYAMSMTAVQKHVGVLEAAGLVGKSRRGREQHVHGSPEAIRTAQRLLSTYETTWRDRADRMASLLADDPKEGTP
jgi:DNA-binding transcriptional ArsR family regulator